MSSLTGAVLIIDSQLDSRKLLKSTLFSMGHKDLKICADPDEGLEVIKNYGSHYQLVISNINSEDQGSIDLVSQMPLYMQMQSIFTHNQNDSHLVDEMILEKPSLFTLKRPFAKNDLEKMIERVLRSRLTPKRALSYYRPLNQDSRILVIDDFETMRQLMRNAFIDLGYFNIDDAVNGQEAYDLIKKAYHEKDPYQLIFADWNMPEMNGLQLLHELQKDHLLRGAPFMMVTAENEKSQVINAISAGVDDYIVKPLNPKTLVQKLEKINVHLENRLQSIKAS